MRRLIIDNNIQQLAEKYRDQMCYKKKRHIISQSCRLLNDLINSLDRKRVVNLGSRITRSRIKKYLEKIIEKYENCLIDHPPFDSLIHEMSQIISTEDIETVKLVDKSSKNEIFLHEEIVRCMRYTYVQRKVFPEYTRTMNIKTCVYCNAQYTITTRNNNTFYQLDHCYPKSKYPYLSANFFNLQPCCGPCNLHKSNKDFVHGNYSPSMWKEQCAKNEDDYFRFCLSDVSIVNYLSSFDKDLLKIYLTCQSSSDLNLRKLLKDYKEELHIDQLYAEHKDVAEEVIWKKQIYSTAYMESLQKAFKSELPKLSASFSRLFMGTYMNPEDILKRPLSKMIQDIAKQLHIEIDDQTQ